MNIRLIPLKVCCPGKQSKQTTVSSTLCPNNAKRFRLKVYQPEWLKVSSSMFPENMQFTQRNGDLMSKPWSPLESVLCSVQVYYTLLTKDGNTNICCLGLVLT